VRRRILVATLVVAAVAVVLFAVPLAVTVRNLVISDELGELEHLATRAERDVSPKALRNGDAITFPPAERGTRIAVYDTHGARRTGAGPDRLDASLRASTTGQVVQHHGRRLAVAVPVIENGRVTAVIRADAPSSETASRLARAWFVIAACAVIALAIAGILALTQARRLAAPLGLLARAANRVGEGDHVTPAPRTGIAEIDDIAAALDAAAHRVDDALTRERQFTADASHQLRTPLTALRVTLENAARMGDDRDAIDTALAQTDRLESTIDQLLLLARDTHTAPTALDLAALFSDVAEQWHGRLEAAGRPLRVACNTELPPLRASSVAVHQIVDVLLSNAAEHGAGAITVRARRVGHGVAIDVSDEGAGVQGDAAAVFERRSGDDPRRGIGLALARSLAEAEGGRLVLANPGAHPVFTLAFAGDGRRGEEG
jgi:signal transduction histidine kinase